MKTLRELYRKHPLGCDGYGAKWIALWEELGRLLENSARLYVRGRYPDWRIDARGTVADLIPMGEERSRKTTIQGLPRYRIRVVLLDGTIVREWGAK